MLAHMRTTMNLSDDLMRRVKQEAAARGTTVTALVDEALRRLLEDRNDEADVRVRLPVVSGRGPLPGVDLHDNASLADLVENS